MVPSIPDARDDETLSIQSLETVEVKLALELE
jgi:hypothetical protein